MKLRHPLKTGLSFGLTSGVITTLGLIVGLHSGTGSRQVVIGGILTIAIADAFSDALGIHISEESENTHTSREIWEATLSTFLSKFIFTLTFAVPVLLFPLKTAIVIGVLWGLGLISSFSFFIARGQGVSPWKAVSEHLIVALSVIGFTYYIGEWVGTLFR